jgi:hypothetical protein
MDLSERNFGFLPLLDINTTFILKILFTTHDNCCCVVLRVDVYLSDVS